MGLEFDDIDSNNGDGKTIIWFEKKILSLDIFV